MTSHRVIPSDEAVPLKGRTFLDCERQGEQMRRSPLPTLLEERARLEGNALVERRQAGHCPYCGSDREREETGTEVRSPDLAARRWRWGLAHQPYLVYPDYTLVGSATAPRTIRFLLLSLPFRAAVLVPSLWLLFKVFKQPAKPHK